MRSVERMRLSVSRIDFSVSGRQTGLAPSASRQMKNSSTVVRSRGLARSTR